MKSFRIDNPQIMRVQNGINEIISPDISVDIILEIQDIHVVFRFKHKTKILSNFCYYCGFP